MAMAEEIRRADNIIWSAAEDYSFAPAFRSFDGNGRADLYWNFILGAARRCFDMDRIEKFLKQCGDQFEGELLVDLAWLGLEHAIYFRSRDSWPNLPELRKRYAEDFLREIDMTQLQDYFDIIRLAYFQEVLGRKPQVSGRQARLLEELKVPPGADTEEAIEQLRRVFQGYFRRDLEPGKARRGVSFRIRLPGGRPGMAIRLFLRRSGLMKTELVSGVFGAGTLERKQGMSLKLIRQQTRREEISREYGEGILPEGAVADLEKEQCTDTHFGCHIHVGGSDIPDPTGTLSSQQLRNLEHYRKNQQRNRNIIGRLTRSLGEILAVDPHWESVSTTAGDLKAERCYRAVHLNDFRIFEKKIWQESYDISFDILLDASASQLNRQERISEAVHILGQSLANNGIDVRIMTYKSIREYLVLNVLKDYQEISCQGIFSYHASGFNRDGLAVRTALSLMDASKRSIRWLIIVSDGNPNDLMGFQTGGPLSRRRDYGGEAAVEELAREVTRAKGKGIRVLGIFMGREDNLAGQELVYGRNLIQLKDPLDLTDSLLRALS